MRKRLAVVGLLAVASAAAAADPPGQRRADLINGMAASTKQEDLTVMQPMLVPSHVRMWEPTSVTLLPTHCHRAFENAVGALYSCAGRVAHTEGIMKGGEIMTYVADYRAALWRAHDGELATLLVLPYAGANDSDAEVLKQVQGKNFAALPVDKELWSASLAPGKLDAGSSSFAPKAARAAFESAAWPSTKTTNSRLAASGEEAVIWGELRDDQEVVIKKLDGQTKWHQPLNGFAQVVGTTPGKHKLGLMVWSRSVDHVEPELDVELQAGHTYIAAYGMDDKPYLEDLGTSAHCERRKIGAFGKARHMPAWLACMK